MISLTHVVDALVCEEHLALIGALARLQGAAALVFAGCNLDLIRALALQRLSASAPDGYLAATTLVQQLGFFDEAPTEASASICPDGCAITFLRVNKFTARLAGLNAAVRWVPCLAVELCNQSPSF